MTADREFLYAKQSVLPMKKKTLKQLFTKNLQRGGIEKGAIYVVVFLVCLIFLGYMFVGGNLPTKLPKESTDLVVLQMPSPETQKGTLQLYTFQGATLTPVPTLNNNQPAQLAKFAEASCPQALTGKVLPQMVWAHKVSQTAASDNQVAFNVFYGSGTPVTAGTKAMVKQTLDKLVNPVLTSARDGNNLPLSPVLYITDVSANASDISGDAQNGGAPQIANTIFGSWRPENGQQPLTQNGTNLGPGADPWPASNVPVANTTPRDLSWSSQIIWKGANLKTKDGQAIQSGKTYRFQVVLHDGNNPPATAQLCLVGTWP